MINYPGISSCAFGTCDVDPIQFKEILEKDTALRILALVTLVILIGLKWAFYRFIAKFDYLRCEKNPLPSDFTLLLDIPGNKTEEEIKKEVRVSCLERSKQVEVVKVNKIYRIKDYVHTAQKVMLEQKELKKMKVLNKTNTYSYARLRDEHIRSLHQLDKLKDQFNHLENTAFNLFANKAFVTFKTQNQRIQAESIFGKLPGIKLYSINGYAGSRAEEPMSYIWENFGQNNCKKLFVRLISISFVCAIIALTFFLILTIKKAQIDWIKGDDKSAKGYFISILVSLFIAIINFVIILCIFVLVDYERRTTHTSNLVSSSLKIFAAMFLNSGLIVLISSYFINGENWMQSLWTANGAVPNIFILRLFTAAFNPLISILDIPFLIKLFKRNQFKRQMRKNPKQVDTVQCELNEIYENNEFDVSRQYNLFFETVSVGFFYALIVPYGCIFAITEFVI